MGPRNAPKNTPTLLMKQLQIENGGRGVHNVVKRLANLLSDG